MSHEEKIHTAISAGKVLGAHLIAAGITMTGVNDVLKGLGLAVALGYGIWKWRNEYKLSKANKNGLKR